MNLQNARQLGRLFTRPTRKTIYKNRGKQIETKTTTSPINGYRGMIMAEVLMRNSCHSLTWTCHANELFTQSKEPESTYQTECCQQRIMHYASATSQ